LPRARPAQNSASGRVALQPLRKTRVRNDSLSLDFSDTGSRRRRPAADARHAPPPRQAHSFLGVPPGTAKLLAFLVAFQEAEPYLGLPVPAFKLMAWLVKQTRPAGLGV